MIEEFLIFKKFNDQNSAVQFGKIMSENRIEYHLENISITFDPLLPNNEFGKEYCIKLKRSDFEKADKLLSEITQMEISTVQDDYYLLSFSDEELTDVISKSDEWNSFDVELAKKLLKDKGKEVTEEQINEIKKQRITALSKPEEGQSIYIIIGYISALFGGVLGIFIGWHLLTYKKTLPNGSRIYAYSENDRKQGNRIVILGGIFFIIWSIYAILKE